MPYTATPATAATWAEVLTSPLRSAASSGGTAAVSRPSSELYAIPSPNPPAPSATTRNAPGAGAALTAAKAPARTIRLQSPGGYGA